MQGIARGRLAEERKAWRKVRARRVTAIPVRALRRCVTTPPRAAARAPRRSGAAATRRVCQYTPARSRRPLRRAAFQTLSADAPRAPCGRRAPFCSAFPRAQDHPFGFVARPRSLPDGSTDLLKWECVVPGKKGAAEQGCARGFRRRRGALASRLRVPLAPHRALARARQRRRLQGARHVLAGAPPPARQRCGGIRQAAPVWAARRGACLSFDVSVGALTRAAAPALPRQ
jgi:hypothetical protein